MNNFINEVVIEANKALKKGITKGNNKMYRDNRGGGFNRGPREMHKVTCADCGKETEVPFKPDGSRPVYCRDCYQKHKPKRF